MRPRLHWVGPWNSDFSVKFPAYRDGGTLFFLSFFFRRVRNFIMKIIAWECRFIKTFSRSNERERPWIFKYLIVTRVYSRHAWWFRRQLISSLRVNRALRSDFLIRVRLKNQNKNIVSEKKFPFLHFSNSEWIVQESEVFASSSKKARVFES